MNYNEHDTLTINNQTLKGQDIVSYCEKDNLENVRQMGLFMADWLNDKSFIEVRTSGSTGAPKTIAVEKNQMLQSAAMTAEFFGFRQRQTALLCLPIRYIAGKMMVVRAMYSHLNLICIEPDDSPFEHLTDNTIVDFAPLVPLQLNGVRDTKSVRKILLGGSPVSLALEESLQTLNAEIYHGYGMTETLSHVALRRVNGKGRSAIYKSLPGIYFSTDERGCLILEVPFLTGTVYTNDVVELRNEHEFIWRGRFDNVVNSGGLKFFPEEIEKKLFPFIPERFFIAGMPDKRFGEKLCLFIEADEYPPDRFETLLNYLDNHLEKYENPKDIFFIKNFETTDSGKIKRTATLSLISS